MFHRQDLGQHIGSTHAFHVFTDDISYKSFPVTRAGLIPKVDIYRVSGLKTLGAKSTSL